MFVKTGFNFPFSSTIRNLGKRKWTFGSEFFGLRRNSPHQKNDKYILTNDKHWIYDVRMNNAKTVSMKRSSTVFLQVVVILIGIGALTFLLWEPLVEGRNVNATLFEVYFRDPFLAWAYSASIAFFVALYQAFRLLTYIGRNEVFSQRSVQALGTIKYCGLIIVGFILLAEAYLFIVRPGDDIAGGVAMGIFIAFFSVIIATAAAVFEKLLQSAVDIKSENDLTV